MRVDYSKNFRNSAKKLSGRMKDSLRNAVESVIEAKDIKEIHGIKKLVAFQYIYRIRIGNYRAFFTFHVQIIDDVVRFEYLTVRGEAYGKKNLDRLRGIDE